MKVKTIYAIVSIALLILMGGCGGSGRKEEAPENVLVTINDSTLTMEDVERKIPSGLAPEDSAEMFSQLVDNWIESFLLTEVAKENVIDIDKINRMAEAYRNRLIIDEYLKMMRNSNTETVKESEVEAYYNQYGESLTLEAPIIKGIYLKTSETDEQLSNIRKWMETATEQSVDNIEKLGMRQATQYEYFADRWIEWSEISELIPYRFEDADLFLKGRKNFETSCGGSVYFLHIYDYLPTGEKMPHEYAINKISEILSIQNSEQFMVDLKRSIYNNAIKEGRMKLGLYDLNSRKVKTTENKNIKQRKK